MTRHRPAQVLRGFTLVELMAVVAVAAVIVALAAPSFTRMIEMQRLRGVQAQLVTDMQFARSEAVARNSMVWVDFRNTNALSCYTTYTAPAAASANGPCDCTRGAGAACSGLADRIEVRTVVIGARSGVTVRPLEPPVPLLAAFGFDPINGGLVKIPSGSSPILNNDFDVDTFLDNERRLRTRIDRSGRPMVCRPASSTMPEAECPVSP